MELPDTFLAGYHQGFWRNGSIARLARTCRAFLEPCLDALWRHQYTLYPLYRTLPEDAFEVRITKTIARTFYDLFAHRPLVPSDWARFDYYARRIKRLGYYDYEFVDDELNTWSAPSALDCECPLSRVELMHLCAYRRTRWILPNLTHLRWNIADVIYTDYIPLFLGPKLKSLAIGYLPRCLIHTPYQPEVLAHILEALVDHCPSLTQLEIYPPGHHSSIPIAASTYAVRCPNLEGYHVNSDQLEPFTPEAVYYFSTKPHLRKLYLRLDENTAEQIQYLSNPPSHRPFQSLQILWLGVRGLPVCVPFIQAMQQCRFICVTFEIYWRPKAKDVFDVLSALQMHCAKETLQTFQIKQAGVYRFDNEPLRDPDHCISIAEMMPLLEFPNIRVFYLTIAILGKLYDQDLKLIADAWPGLIIFRFMDYIGAGIRSPATWYGVGYLVTRCPQMIQCGIPVDLTVDNVNELASAPGFRPNRWLRWFHLLDTAFPDDPEPLARALFTIAPRLIQVTGFGPESEDSGDTIRTVDPLALLSQVQTMMCRFRTVHYPEYKHEDDGLSLPEEWNPWSGPREIHGHSVDLALMT